MVSCRTTAVKDSQFSQKYEVKRHDYIHTSIKILEEISKKAGKITLREDNILFMLSTRLKDICVKYGVFIMSATQLSGNFADAETPDQNLLRGAKSIADEIYVVLSRNVERLLGLRIAGKLLETFKLQRKFEIQLSANV